MSTSLAILSSKLAQRFDMGDDGADVVGVLKATAFKGPATDAQLTALLIVANQFALNPFTKEIYAFPDKNNGIVPVVGVDGWSRIINSHAQFDGMEFEQDDESCTCIIFRKDRGHAIRVTEWLAECKRNVQPWQSHPRRMLRHKAMIQCARLAFGFVGIYEQDEAERILEQQQPATTRTVNVTPTQLPPYPEDDFYANFPKWQAVIQAGRRTAADIVAMISTKGVLSESQTAAIFDCAPVDSIADEVNA